MTSQEPGVGFTMTLAREFAAPRALVFDCFTKAGHLAKWWGPHGFDTPVAEADARPGGAILLHMRAPDGGVNAIEGEYGEVSPPERLVFTLRGFRGEDGSWGIEHESTLAFTDVAGGTLLKMATVVKQVSEDLRFALSGMKEGWSQSLDKMDALLAEDPA
jgi:uncharacterized protein YndB with AHSA1/START domain